MRNHSNAAGRQQRFRRESPCHEPLALLQGRIQHVLSLLDGMTDASLLSRGRIAVDHTNHASVHVCARTWRVNIRQQRQAWKARRRKVRGEVQITLCTSEFEAIGTRTGAMMLAPRRSFPARLHPRSHHKPCPVPHARHAYLRFKMGTAVDPTSSCVVVSMVESLEINR